MGVPASSKNRVTSSFSSMARRLDYYEDFYGERNHDELLEGGGHDCESESSSNDEDDLKPVQAAITYDQRNKVTREQILDGAFRAASFRAPVANMTRSPEELATQLPLSTLLTLAKQQQLQDNDIRDTNHTKHHSTMAIMDNTVQQPVWLTNPWLTANTEPGFTEPYVDHTTTLLEQHNYFKRIMANVGITLPNDLTTQANDIPFLQSQLVTMKQQAASLMTSPDRLQEDLDMMPSLDAAILETEKILHAAGVPVVDSGYTDVDSFPCLPAQLVRMEQRANGILVSADDTEVEQSMFVSDSDAEDESDAPRYIKSTKPTTPRYEKFEEAKVGSKRRGMFKTAISPSDGFPTRQSTLNSPENGMISPRDDTPQAGHKRAYSLPIEEDIDQDEDNITELDNHISNHRNKRLKVTNNKISTDSDKSETEDSETYDCTPIRKRVLGRAREAFKRGPRKEQVQATLTKARAARKSVLNTIEPSTGTSSQKRLLRSTKSKKGVARSTLLRSQKPVAVAVNKAPAPEKKVKGRRPKENITLTRRAQRARRDGKESVGVSNAAPVVNRGKVVVAAIVRNEHFDKSGYVESP